MCVSLWKGPAKSLPYTASKPSAPETRQCHCSTHVEHYEQVSMAGIPVGMRSPTLPPSVRLREMFVEFSFGLVPPWTVAQEWRSLSLAPCRRWTRGDVGEFEPEDLLRPFLPAAASLSLDSSWWGRRSFALLLRVYTRLPKKAFGDNDTRTPTP